MRRRFHRIVLRRCCPAFIVPGLACYGFGVGTLNLFFLLEGNTELLAEHGRQAVMDGACSRSRSCCSPAT